jgi:hypothetical protein
MFTNSRRVETPHRSQQRNWVHFAKKASRFSSLLLWRLSKAYAGSAIVLVDELEARGIVNLVSQLAITGADDVQGVVQTVRSGSGLN